ncbi:hypothetical protein [Roseicella sp. DB1501]|uniref:hypothetical protein n=1 Tax=Roseicella sp. DB1501 TaxID=2730925 RepID=UPI001490B198|nr:hypothetical protein [Roseicella sp. DB1501]NOG71909.1 hypothetical protein [Roseicella sp. DB1501]
MTNASSIKINRAPVLTLWAAVVAERLGHPPETALSLASAVAGTAAHAKARRLGIAEASREAQPAPAEESVQLLGRAIRLAHDEDGVVLAAGDGRPAPAAPVRAYVERAFGRHLPAVRQAMEALAARHAPEELNRIGFRLYEHFRPEVPADIRGWGARGVLELGRIREADRA